MDFIADDFPAIGAALAKLEGKVDLGIPISLDQVIDRAIAAQDISECREAAQAAQKYANALRQQGSYSCPAIPLVYAGSLIPWLKHGQSS